MLPGRFLRSEKPDLQENFETGMKTIDNDKELCSLSNERIEELRKELQARISREELNYSWQLEALDEIFTVSKIDSKTFQRFWIRPLLAAGLSPEAALAHVIDSYFQPN